MEEDQCEKCPVIIMKEHARKICTAHGCKKTVLSKHKQCANCLDINKKSRQKKKEKGLCGSCGVKPAISGLKYCQKCRNWDKENRRKRKEKGLCTGCGIEPATLGKTICEKCRNCKQNWEQEKRRERKEAGLCSRCGMVPVTYSFKHTKCDNCTSYARWKALQRRSKKRKWFEIMEEDHAKALFKMPCCYCRGFEEHTNVNGIDRVDSNRGYTKENTVPCCSVCNRMKMDSTLDSFIERCTLISKRFHSYGVYHEC